MSILDTIAARKAERLRDTKRKTPLPELRGRLQECDAPRDFRGAVRRKNEGALRLIAELKKASPSKGLIRKDFDPVSIASLYERKGADALSVLTEEDFFQGHLSFLREVRQNTALPLLRKDFIFDAYQIYEARVNGADALLLIAALLERNQAQEYLHLAAELGLQVLFEVHDEEELEKALLVNAEIIGINNRDLKTLEIDLSTTLRLRKEIPPGKIVVSESGIRTRSDVERLREAGVDTLLVGTSLMQSEDIGRKIDELLGKR
ncbi:MAG: indole-3-glycerol phosphate synthase TrpC [Alphaproteobacteria bacterium]|uniref:Indole-3-glycerol phosphate synthase n=1 Tax=Candidatus Nitrobium versatile TaxID=2884831 RepID=A0A953M041_9BACT|nr:indole-3-glycerol phosphate synthase TrpC [Candidatus Nitrobium versatile]